MACQNSSSSHQQVRTFTNHFQLELYNHTTEYNYFLVFSEQKLNFRIVQ